MDIKPIASGSSGNAYLIDDGESTLLLECGLPYRELMKKLDFRMPDACLISHSHKDHSAAAQNILNSGIPLYAPEDTLQELFGAEALATERGSVKPYKNQEIGSYIVKPLPMKHDVTCFGYMIYSTATKETLFFATDTSYIPYQLPPIDYLMIEANYREDLLYYGGDYERAEAKIKRLAATHMSINTTCAWLQQQDLSRVKRIYLLHLSDSASNADEFKRRVIEGTGIPVTIC